MDSREFVSMRKKLNKTQVKMAQLLGKSVKAIHSYEQGWRTIPPDVERQILFLFARSHHNTNRPKPCWTIMKCPPDRKKQCPAWEFRAGRFCWFVNGTICGGEAMQSWKDKLKVCRKCEVMTPLFTSDAG